MSRVRTSLERHFGERRPDDAELKAMAARAWHERKVLVVRLDDIRNEFVRRAAEEVGTQMYGPRNRER